MRKPIDLQSLTPLKALRKYCLWCCNDSFSEIKLCPATECLFYNFRDGHKHGLSFSIKIIRKKCLDCAGTSDEVKVCEHKDCPLYIYNKGKSKRKGRTMTLEEKQNLRDKFLKGRNKVTELI